MSASPLLQRHTVAELLRGRHAGPDPDALESVSPIVGDVRARGEAAVREYAERLGDIAPGAPLVHEPPALRSALAQLPDDDRRRLERVADRIRAFAEAQRAALAPVRVPLPGGVAEHQIAPVERAGCYAPGGRYPLPSSVLMTALPARVAGVREVWIASPRPRPLTLAAAAVAEADGLLAVGGAQAIAALAYGAGAVPPADIVVGPGNRYVAAGTRTAFVKLQAALPPGYQAR